jgi:hypothetical protein
MTLRPPVDWEAVRAAYENREGTTAEISRLHHISTRTLQLRAVAGGWRRRNESHAVDRSAIITRLFHLLERQIIGLDEEMTTTGEKEVAVLGKLASTLEKLIDIDNAAGGKPRLGQDKQMRTLRNKLAERIDQLKRT